MFGRKPKDVDNPDPPQTEVAAAEQPQSPVPVEDQKSFWAKLLPVMACGAGLFSDGYINNVRFPISQLNSSVWLTWTAQVIGSVVTVLAIEYGDVWANSNAKHYLGDIAFAGTVVGQLGFGYLYVCSREKERKGVSSHLGVQKGEGCCGEI